MASKQEQAISEGDDSDGNQLPPLSSNPSEAFIADESNIFGGPGVSKQMQDYDLKEVVPTNNGSEIANIQGSKGLFKTMIVHFVNSLLLYNSIFFFNFSIAIQSGDFVAFQTSARFRWMSNGGAPGVSACPGFTMDGHDYHRCWGEVFQIFRKDGPGYIKTGDPVGIYYPREGTWLGCPGHVCYKARCPGRPNTHYGFSGRHVWFRCVGEVFKIYARDKGMGSNIYHRDDITIYLPAYHKYVGFLGGKIHREGCPGNPPPRRLVYDHCYGEIFTIWKKGFN